jgi:2'-5' RNA ligase
VSPLPAQMRDRWKNRREPTPGHGTLYWHMLARRYPQARAAATEAQEQLALFTGLHMTPLEWLHMTTLIAGTTDDISKEQISTMLTEAQRALSSVQPITVALGPVLYHPEAIMLGVQPQEALLPVLEATREATLKATGRDGELGGSLPTWTPHMTVSYSTAEQPAGPIIDALGKSVRTRDVQIRSVSLVIQWGPERLWDWEPVGTVELGSKAASR